MQPDRPHDMKRRRAAHGLWRAVAVSAMLAGVGFTARGAESTIAFASNRSGAMDIHIMDADGDNVTNVSRNAAWD
jgi:hypothetical protein